LSKGLINRAKLYVNTRWMNEYRQWF
jgi:hypothetical protein